MKRKILLIAASIFIGFVSCKKKDEAKPEVSENKKNNAIISYNDGSAINVDSANAVLYSTLGDDNTSNKGNRPVCL